MKTISLLNLKGGVAKSFSAVNIAYELWRRGYEDAKALNPSLLLRGILVTAYQNTDGEKAGLE